MKRLLCLAIIITVLAACVSAYADTPLSIVTNAKLEPAPVNAPYSATIEADGGVPPYTFTMFNKLYFPPGLTLTTTEDGKGLLSGTPTSGGVTYCNMKVIVTDANGDKAEKVFSLNVPAKRVTFKVTQDSFVYDGQSHSVTAVPYIDGMTAAEQDIDLNFTCNEQTNVGNYSVKISVSTPGYICGSVDKNRLYITQNPYTRIAFENRSFAYDGAQKKPTIYVKGRYTEDADEVDLPYTALYEGIGGTDYSSNIPPSKPGNYRVTCVITNNNFATPKENSTTFEIKPNLVRFSLNNTSKFYWGDTWDREYSPSVASVTDFTVKYIKDDAEYDKPSEPGDYTVRITMGEESLYSVGEILPPTVTVHKKPVNFTVSEASQIHTGSALYPVIENDSGLSENDDYTVEYYKDENKTTPVDVGEYKIVITLLDTDHYEFGSQSKETFVITQRPEIILEDGNSIFARINADGVDTESKKQSFLESYKYNDILYSAKAWEENTNLDADEKALFMYNRESIALPGASAVGFGESAQVNAVLKTNSGDIDLTGKTEYTPVDLPCGIYTIEYSVEGDTSQNPVTATRNAVVLWQLGDVNFDRNINSVDGNYIMGNSELPETTADDKLFKYRMCDVNKDGLVNDLDRDVIYARIVNPIIEYYR